MIFFMIWEKQNQQHAHLEFSEEHVHDLSVSMKLRVRSFEFGWRSNNCNIIWSHRFLCYDFRASWCFGEEWDGRKNHRVWWLYGVDDQ